MVLTKIHTKTTTAVSATNNPPTMVSQWRKLEDSATKLTGMKTIRLTPKPMIALMIGMIMRFNGPPRSPDQTMSPPYKTIGTIVRNAVVQDSARKRRINPRFDVASSILCEI